MTDDEAIERLENEVGLEPWEITPNLIELARDAERRGFSPPDAHAFVKANPTHSFAPLPLPSRCRKASVGSAIAGTGDR